MGILAALTWTFAAVDLQRDFIPWLEHLHRTGPIAALAHPFSNYAPPYLYLLAAGSLLNGAFEAWDILKAIFFGGHILLILAMARLLRESAVTQPLRWACCLCLVPSLFANPAVVGQCDAFWAAALVMALTAALGRRHFAMFAWCGLAVGLKLQAAFMGPFFLAIALGHRVPIRLWLAAPAVYLATLVPAALAGWPLADLLTVYFRQAAWTETLALNSPNIWMLIETAHLPVPAIAGTLAAVGASVGFVWYFATRPVLLDGANLLRAACLCALIVPGLLPRMHERYFFMADVLTLALAATKPGEWRPALFTVSGSSLGLLGYFTGNPAFPCAGAICMIYATWLVARACFVRRASDETIRIDIDRDAHAARHRLPA